MTTLVVLEGVVILLLTIVVAGLLRSHGAILRALHELGVDLEDAGPAGFRVDPSIAAPGTPLTAASDISGETLDGGAVAIPVATANQRTLVAFLSAGCAGCGPFWTALRSGTVDIDERVVVVTKSPGEESVAVLEDLAPPDVPLVMSSDAFVDFGVPGSPYFVLVDSGRVIGEGSAGSWSQLTTLVGNAAGDARPRRRRTGGAVRETRADAELRRAGVEPGDPSLYDQPDPRAER